MSRSTSMSYPLTGWGQFTIQTVLFDCCEYGFPATAVYTRMKQLIGAAKEAARATAQPICMHYQDLMTIKKRIYEWWRERCSEYRSDLNAQSAPSKWCRQRAHRKEEVIINRLRLGHARATRGYLFDGIEARRSLWRWCTDAALSVGHILLECALVEESFLSLKSEEI